MSSVEKKLEAMGITLPEVARPVAAYVPWVTADKMVFVSGNLPTEKGELKYKGRLGDNVSLEDGASAARLAAVNAIAALKAAVGDLDKVKRIVRVEGFVASTPEFNSQPGVVNGASQLILEAFGDAGAHSRFAVGCVSLPLGAPVEIGLIAQIE